MNFDDPEFALAVSKANTAMASRLAPTRSLSRAGTMLRMVKQGLSDMQETDHDRILFGFLGVVVFGRSMTLVMQNLRTHDEEAFNNWYAPWQKEMKDDPLMRYFYKLRTMVIHHDGPAICIMLSGFGEDIAPVGSISVDGLPLPDRHLGQPLDDTSMRNQSRLYVEYLQRMFDSYAPVAIAVQDRIMNLRRAQ